MKIAKPLLLVATPIGLAIGLYEGWRLAGGLVVVMAMLIGVLGIAMASVVLTIRREKRAEKERQEKGDSKDDLTNGRIRHSRESGNPGEP